MKRQTLWPVFIASFGLALLAATGQAVVRNDLYWASTAATGDLGTAANWAGGIAPPNDGSADLVFAGSIHTGLTLSASLVVNSLTFESKKAYTVGSLSANAYTLALGAGGLAVEDVYDGDGGYDPTRVDFAAGLPLQLFAAQTWFVGNRSSLVVHGAIAGDGASGLTFIGGGDVDLLGANTYAGGTEINGPLSFRLGSGTAFGTGTITIKHNDVSFASAGGNLTLANAIVFQASSGESTDFYYDGSKGALTLSGNLTLKKELDLYLTGRSPLTLSGNIGEDGESYALVYSGTGSKVILSGTNTYTGGTYGNSGSLIFASAASIPTAGVIRANGYAYLGVGSTVFPTSLQADFLDRFDKTYTTGAIGFDTDPAQGSPNNFTGAIDLTGFSSDARLGSATRAIISGPITPQDTVYRFGMGGGVLEVASNLTGDRSVLADSTYNSGAEHLLVRLTGTNDYTGGTKATAAGLIFSTPGSLPASGDLTLGYLGYISLQLPASPANDATTIPDFLSRFGPPANSQATVGFESADLSTPRLITAPIDFTGLANFNNGSFSLGTSTNVTLAGTITMPYGYRFTAYRGGQLNITSVLTGAMSVTLGAYTPLTEPLTGSFSTITLSGDNSYTGLTDLKSGRLVVGQTNGVVGTDATTALGTGTLRTNGYYFANGRPSIQLAAATSGTLIAAPIYLYQSGLDLTGNNSFTLSGPITGGSSEQLAKYGTGTVTFSGANTFAGGVYVAEGNVTFTQDTAAGSGELKFGEGAASATFTSGTPSAGYLTGGTASAFVNLAPGSTLTLTSPYNYNLFGGIITGTGANLTLDTYNSTFTGANTYTGTTTVNGYELRLGDGGTTGSLAGDVALTNYYSALTFSRSDAVTYAGVVSGSGRLKQEGAGTLTLTGANTFSGGTMVNAGSLLLASSSTNSGSIIGPVGSGTLQLKPGSTLGLATANSNLTLDNDIGLYSSGTSFVDTPGSSGQLTLPGLISGYGGLTKTGTGVLTLKGANSFYGPLTIDSGWVDLKTSDTAAGEGSLFFSATNTHARFWTATPVINGLASSSSATNAEVELRFNTDARLTINQYSDSTYYGDLRGDNGVGLNHDGVFVKAGSGALTLSGSFIAGHYGQGATHDILEVQEGTLILSNVSFEATTTAIKVNGGALAVNGTPFANPIIFGASGGTLGGNSTINSLITAGPNVVISPGNSPGTLTFAAGLTYSPGGSYNWELQSAVGGAGIGWDVTAVTGGTFDLSTLTPGSFTLNVISLDVLSAAGDVSDFNSSSDYSWTILTAPAPITGFSAANFTINTGSFSNSNTGVFFLSASGNSLNLNFTAVPEPSTYALLALGLGCLGLTAWRKRRA